jgi:alpha-galactosidase
MRRGHITTVLAALMLLMAGAGAPPVRASGGLAMTPPMGWNSWNAYACGPEFHEANVRAQADAIIALGLDELGYEYVNLDGCWQPELRYPGDTGRDADGNIVVDAVRFPSGIAALADYVHARGLKLGIYTDVGAVGCKNRPGSAGYEAQDAAQYAAWGIDYVKIDWCQSLTQNGMIAAPLYARWRDALATYAPHIVYSICNWGEQAPWNWGPETGNLWRNTIDIWDEWEYDWGLRLSVTTIIDRNSRHAARARPGAWNDPDMLVVGLRGAGGVEGRGMTTDEYRAHFGMWAIMAAPLLLGNDLTTMDSTTLEIVSNPEVIAVNQDRLGIQAPVVNDPGAGIQVYAKPMSGAGVRAVAVLNRTWEAADVVVHWSDIGLAARPATVRDLWKRLDLGVHASSVTVRVPSHGMVLMKIDGDEPTVAPGTTYLSDNVARLAQNGWGPMERDMSVGHNRSGDGAPISLDGTPYAKGLGVHASSRIEYHLGGTCSSFSARVGVDDEMGARGSVVFEVWADDRRVFQSPSMTGSSATAQIDVNVAGATILRLVVLEGDDMLSAENGYDHADWADALVTCGDDRHSLIESFVSDMPLSVVRNGWGSIERDRSNGERGDADGGPISIGGRYYPKGLGVHAGSMVLVALQDGRCTEFLAEVGVDDEVGSNGSVQFLVRDQSDTVLWASDLMFGWEGATSVRLPLAGVSLLKLEVTDGGNGAAYDHADWADARVVCTAPLPTEPAAPVPAEPAAFVGADVGGVGIGGSDESDGLTHMLVASGADIWGSADAFRYKYQVLSGDGSITARVTSLGAVDPWTKAGVMIRHNLSPSSPHGFVFLSGGNGIAFQRRTSSGGRTEHTPGPAADAPVWVRLTRAGTFVTADASFDGSTWVRIGSEHLPIGLGQVLVGLALTSHDNTTLAAATFDNVIIGP